MRNDPSKFPVPVYGLKIVKERTIYLPSYMADNSITAASIAKSLIGSSDRENLIAIFLNVKNQVIGSHIISIGGISNVSVHMREVFKAAIVKNAAGLILAHNHPSGDPTPSEEDIRFTKRVIEGGKLMGVFVLDHIIVSHTGSHENHYSMLDRIGSELFL